jgi:hypothetical protein
LPPRQGNCRRLVRRHLDFFSVKSFFSPEVSGYSRTGRVAEVPPKFARVGGSRPDFGPEKAKKHKKTLIKSKLNQN